MPLVGGAGKGEVVRADHGLAAAVPAVAVDAQAKAVRLQIGVPQVSVGEQEDGAGSDARSNDQRPPCRSTR